MEPARNRPARICHCEEQSDAAIPSTMIRILQRQLTLYQEIATACGLAMTGGVVRWILSLPLAVVVTFREG